MKALWFIRYVLVGTGLSVAAMGVSIADTVDPDHLVSIAESVTHASSQSSSQSSAAHSKGSTEKNTSSAASSSAKAKTSDSDNDQSSAHTSASNAKAADQKTASTSSEQGSAANTHEDHDKSNSGSNQQTPKKPDLTPTGYVEALIPSLSVARDLGKNCHEALASNAKNQDICDQFNRAVNNLAQKQSQIEKTTPRPTDTHSVAPHLMDEFNQLSDQLDQEVQYLRAYRATQDD